MNSTKKNSMVAISNASKLHMQNRETPTCYLEAQRMGYKEHKRRYASITHEKNLTRREYEERYALTLNKGERR